MTLSYAGVLLSACPPELAALVERKFPLNRLWEWAIDPQGFGGARPPRGVLPPDPVELDLLVWPTNSAARWAYGHFVVDSDSLALIRQQVYGPAGYSAQPLVISDGTGGIAPLMWMLPPRALLQVGGKVGAWLLTLCDERWFWWQRAADIQVTAGVTAWTDLYAAVATGLGIALTVDVVPAAYLTPPATFSASYEYLPPLLDAVAAAVGQRIVRGYDGKVKATNVATARAALLANVNAGYGPWAGGQLAIGWT